MTMATLDAKTNDDAILENEKKNRMHINIQDLHEDTSATHLSDVASLAENSATMRSSEDERRVGYARWLVFWVMTAAAILVGVETFKVSSQQEQEVFVEEVRCGTATRQIQWVNFPVDSNFRCDVSYVLYAMYSIIRLPRKSTKNLKFVPRVPSVPF
jgi:hypothetical protein